MSGHLTEEQYRSQVAAVWRVTVILTIVTIVEVGMALFYFYYLNHHGKSLLNLLFILLSVWKAYFIIGEFMHLRYEKRAFMMSLGVPLVFLIWAIIAFAWEGLAWYDMKFPN
jgi:hypothetical protein